VTASPAGLLAVIGRYFGTPGLIAGMGINLSGAFIPSA